MKIEVVFTLDAGEANVDVFSWERVLQIKPTECGNRGDKSLRGKGHQNISSYWSITTEIQDTDSINAQVSNLIGNIKLKSTEIRALIEKHELDCGVAAFIWLDDEEDISDVDLYLDCSTIHTLSELRADFAIKIYK